MTGMTEGESGARTGEGGRKGSCDEKDVPLQKNLPTGFAG